MADKIFENSMSIGKGFTRWDINSPGYDNGEIFLPTGIVTAYMQGDDKHRHITRLGTVINGRLYMRTFDRRYSRRGVVRKARQFIDDLTGGN